MTKFKFLLSTALAGAFLAACSSTPIYTDGKSGQVKQGDSLTLGLDREDFENAADVMVQSL